MIEQLDVDVIQASIILAFVIGALLGWLVRHARARGELERLRDALAFERRLHEERVTEIERARQQLADSFSALSTQALRQNNESFLRLAEQSFKHLHVRAQADLDKREKSIDGMVRPIRETLEKTERQMREIEKDRRQAYGALDQHLKMLASAHQNLQSETRNLVQALRRPEVRGQWGEMTLRRLAELAGMVEHCDFEEQAHRSTEDGRLRPDMIVRMPDRREIVVDAKTPLDAYLDAEQAADELERGHHLLRHARHVRERVRELASKAYWTQFRNSPDFVVLFIPGDQFLSAALDKDAGLMEYAMNNKVILATPSSLVALLRAVAFGWRQLVVAENAEKIRDLGEELYRRIATFTEHLGRLGRSLGQSLDHYNRAVGSLERQVLPGARRFTEMGIHAKKELEELEPLLHAPRLSPSEDES
jgi:DNA recombination protein RmuC